MLDVQKINANVSIHKSANIEQQKVEALSDIAKTQADKEHDGAEFVKGDEIHKSAYEKVSFNNSEKVTEVMKQYEEARMEKLSNMIMQMLGKQGENFKMTTIDMSELLSAEDIAAAKAAIAEGGEYSVTAVSSRILEMAKALSNGDMTKFNLLKDAVIKGFESAERIWGGKMPEITGQTYDAVMKGFDSWAAEANGEAVETTENTVTTDLSE